MGIVGFYARKGGVGKSTYAFNFACYAATKIEGKVLLVSVDPQGDSVRWSAPPERRLKIDDVFESVHGFDVLFAPKRAINADFVQSAGASLVIVDMPPEAETIADVYPDVWVTPIDGRNALLDTIPVLRAMRVQGGKILLLPNRIDAAGGQSKLLITEALQQVPDSVILPTVLESTVVARVAECSLPAWKVPYGLGSQGAMSVQKVCEAILEHFPDLQPSPKRRKRS